MSSKRFWIGVPVRHHRDFAQSSDAVRFSVVACLRIICAIRHLADVEIEFEGSDLTFIKDYSVPVDFCKRVIALAGEVCCKCMISRYDNIGISQTGDICIPVLAVIFYALQLVPDFLVQMTR